MKIKELRNLSKDQREDRLQRYQKELMDIRSQLSAGGSIDNPGRIKDLKRAIARLKTLKREAELGINQ